MSIGLTITYIMISTKYPCTLIRWYNYYFNFNISNSYPGHEFFVTEVGHKDREIIRFHIIPTQVSACNTCCCCCCCWCFATSMNLWSHSFVYIINTAATTSSNVALCFWFRYSLNYYVFVFQYSQNSDDVANN